jgi:hypothetical protein
MEINKSKGVKAKNRAHKLKSSVNWQGELKQKGIKQARVKQDFQGTAAIPLYLPKRSHDQRLKNSTLTHTYCMTHAKDEQ